MRTYVDLICRDLRAFGGTSLDHKFLVGGPKSIHTTGNPGVTVKLGMLSEKNKKKWENSQSYRREFAGVPIQDLEFRTFLKKALQRQNKGLLG